MQFPANIHGNPVAMLAYVIGRQACPDGPDFQVVDEDGFPMPIYECITPEGCGVNIGQDAILEATATAVKELEKHGFKLVRAE